MFHYILIITMPVNNWPAQFLFGVISTLVGTESEAPAVTVPGDFNQNGADFGMPVLVEDEVVVDRSDAEESDNAVVIDSAYMHSINSDSTMTASVLVPLLGRTILRVTGAGFTGVGRVVVISGHVFVIVGSVARCLGKLAITVGETSEQLGQLITH